MTPAHTLENLSVAALIAGWERVGELIKSVAALPRDSWRLWLVCLDDPARVESLAREHAPDDRVRVMPLTSLIRPDGSWLPPGDGEYVVLLDSQAVPASGLSSTSNP